jgi:hypothetical protein
MSSDVKRPTIIFVPAFIDIEMNPLGLVDIAVQNTKALSCLKYVFDMGRFPRQSQR